MGFVYPLFLIAGLCLLIPLLIHLFNLRRYRKMDFPSLRFLRSYMVQNKKMSKVQKKMLLIARMLCITFLVLAFAQPFWTGNAVKDRKNAAWVIYIDNSMSMELRSGQQSLLDKAKAAAAEWLESSTGQSFYVISNDALYQAQPLSKQEAIQAVNKINLSPVTIDADQFGNVAQSLKETLFKQQIELVVFSDFQKNIWTSDEAVALGEGIEIIGFPVHLDDDKISNVYIDTVYFLEAPVDPGQSIPLVTEIRKSGNKAEEISVKVAMNDQNRSAKVLSFGEQDSLITDTTMIQLPGGKWNGIEVGFQSRALTADDAYFMTGRIATLTHVLIYNQGPANGFLSASFAAQNGVQPLQRPWSGQIENERNEYALIVLQGLTQLSTTQAEEIRKILDRGGSIAIFWGMNASIAQVNEGLGRIAPIRITGLDTAMQQIVDLQSSHPLMRDVLKTIPDHIQLPYSHYGYKMKAGITAGGQDLMRYRDGSPYISQYNIGPGKLYLFASPLHPDAGNLITSHLFAPIIQKMTVNSGSNHIYAAEMEQGQHIWVAGNTEDAKAVYKFSRDQTEYIPRQQSKGMGTTVFIPEQLNQAGIYHLGNGQKSSETEVGINYSRRESEIIPATPEELKKTFGDRHFSLFNNLDQLKNFGNTGNSFPFWKIAIAIALLLFIWESYLLAGRGGSLSASRSDLQTEH